MWTIKGEIYYDAIYILKTLPIEATYSKPWIIIMKLLAN
jgi:hypothetical protein